MAEEKQKQEPIADWTSFFNNLLAPFNGDCLLLLRAKKGKLIVEGIASDMENLGFVVATNQAENRNPLTG